MPSQDELEGQIGRIEGDLESAKNDLSSAEDTIGDLEDELSRVKADLKELERAEPILKPHELHFRIKVDELADAIYEGRVVSISMNGCGTREDAVRMAATMLSACGLPV